MICSENTTLPVKLEIIRFFRNLFSITEYLFDAFVNYDNMETALNPLTDLIAACGDYIAQFRDGRTPTPEESRLAVEGAEILKMVSRQIVDISNTVGAEENQPSSQEDPAELYKSTRGRLPSHLNLTANLDLGGSAISPYGQGVTKEALALAREKGLKKCIAMLVASQLINRTAEDIVKFIFMYLDQFDPVELGDYISSDGGTTDEEKKLMSQVRYRFLRNSKNRDLFVGGTNWKGMDYDVAIRHFLTRCGFRSFFLDSLIVRLPGESQRIDRLVEAFSQCYWEDNQQFFSCPDTVYVLTFATIMLNTDLHNPNVPKERKMKLNEFIQNNRGIDNGEDVDPVDLLGSNDS